MCPLISVDSFRIHDMTHNMVLISYAISTQRISVLSSNTKCLAPTIALQKGNGGNRQLLLILEICTTMTSLIPLCLCHPGDTCMTSFWRLDHIEMHVYHVCIYCIYGTYCIFACHGWRRTCSVNGNIFYRNSSAWCRNYLYDNNMITWSSSLPSMIWGGKES